MAAFVAQAAPAEESDARDLLERGFAHLYSADYVQTLELTTRSEGLRPLSRRLQMVRRQSEQPGKTLLRFLDPYEVRKTGVLILENRRGSDDLYVYLPALRMTRRLSAAQRGDAFFGTDLSYEDVEPRRIDDYEIESVLPGEAGSSCTQIRARMRPEAESAYDEAVFCVEPDRAVILWSEFLRKGDPQKRLEIDPNSLRAIDGRLIPFQMTMKNLRAGSETQVSTERYEPAGPIPDSVFSTRNLESGSAAHDRRRARRSEASE